MKLLFVAQHQLWPLTTGARIRNYYLARELSRRAEVTFVQILRPEDQDASHPPEIPFHRLITLRRTEWYTGINLARGLVGPWPVTMLGYGSRRIADPLCDLLRSNTFDAVQMENIHLSFYLDLVRTAPSSPLLVSDWHNIESELMTRYAVATRNPLKKIMAYRTAQLLEEVEQRALGTSNATVVPSERERQTVLARSPQTNAQLVPNGVDVAYYDLEKQAAAELAPRPIVLFVGSMDYHANVEAVTWFVREVWPRIQARHTGVDFAIVGRDPEAAVRKLASDRIVVTGTVADVRPFYRRAVAVVAPLLVGGGTRLKILEAMAAGVPVVSTTLGAEGIEAEHERHLLLADTAEQMAAALERLLISKDERTRLVSSARELVRQQYDWCSVGAKLLAIYEVLLESRASPGKARDAAVSTDPGT